MRVAVTGGSGFIGSRVVAELHKREHNALVIDRHVGVDVLDPDLASMIYDADAVIHLAGMLGTSELFEVAEQAVDVNVKGTINVLRACEKYGIHYVGIMMPEVWDNVYQATKHAARRLASAWHRHRDVPVSHVRAFNVFGPGQKYGPNHPQKIIPTFATKAWESRPIPIWGSGHQFVDLVYVDDVARMLVDAMAFGDDRIFDAGTGDSITVRHVAETVWSMAENPSEADLKFLPMREGEHFTREVCASGEGWELLGWKPEFRLEELHDTVYSYRPR